jgi:serine protease
VPSGFAGAPCTSGSQCTNAGGCIPEFLDGGIGSDTGFVGGYCTGDCTSAACLPGSACINIGSSTQPANRCLQTCPGPGTFSTCRFGYTCVPLTLSTGQALPHGVCFIACTSDQDCGSPRTCNLSNGLCQ